MGPRSNLGFHFDRDQFLTAALQDDARQRTGGRPLQDRSVVYGKMTLVTRAFQPIVRARVEDRAREVRAFSSFPDQDLRRVEELSVMVAFPDQQEDYNYLRLRTLCELFGVGLVTFELSPSAPHFQDLARAQRFSPDMFYVNEFAQRLSKSDKSKFEILFR